MSAGLIMEKTKLLIKNIPVFTPEIKDVFKSIKGVLSVKTYGRCRALLRFTDELCATAALRVLHQSEFFGRLLSVEYLGNRIQSMDFTDINAEKPSGISEFVKSLYATSNSHGFEQPPLPYLRYNYPPINRTILDSISITLLTNSKFYHQVLHLMNRMNLEPPFLPLEKPFIPPGEPCDATTQTDSQTVNPTKNLLVASDESELESDLEHLPSKVNKKRKLPLNDDIIKNKVRKIITHLHEKRESLPSTTRRELNIQTIFDADTRNYQKKISMNVATVKLPEKATNAQHVDEQSTATVEITSTSRLVGEELSQNRIPESQLKELAVYKNYRRGEPSNKLYIKNLSKDVTEKDLEQIYSRFVEQTKDIDIKLMLFGKMKGQAFVTFNKVDDNFELVEKALEETNGFIYKNKPMVVCFGKKS